MRKTTSEERGGGMFLVYYVLGLRFPFHLHITSSPALSGERLFFKDVIEFLVEMERNGIPKNSQSIMINKHDCFFVATTTKKKSNETRGLLYTVWFCFFLLSPCPVCIYLEAWVAAGSNCLLTPTPSQGAHSLGIQGEVVTRLKWACPRTCAAEATPCASLSVSSHVPGAACPPCGLQVPTQAMLEVN